MERFMHTAPSQNLKHNRAIQLRENLNETTTAVSREG